MEELLTSFSLVILNYGYLSCDINCYYLKSSATVNNLTACLIFVKYHIYKFSNFLSKVFFRALFLYLNL